MITRSYFLLSISQLCKTIVCLFPRFLNDIRFTELVCAIGLSQFRDLV